MRRVTIKSGRATGALAALVLGARAAAAATEPLVVASLNPVVTDLARQIGRDRVTIIEIVRPGENTHRFQPSTADLARLQTARLVLISGKGLERYLDDLRGALRPGQIIVDVGAAVPSRQLGEGHEHDGHGVFILDPDDGATGEDPHWWYSIANARRAARSLMVHFTAASPKDGPAFRAAYGVYADRLELLELWARGQLAPIQPTQRKLATAHAAFGYFCAEFGFRSIAVQGLSTEAEPSPAHLRAVVDAIRRERIGAIFPEANTNPKLLESMVKETGIRVGGVLLSGSPDPAEPTYEAMMRHNVRTIAAALVPPP